MAVDPAFKNVGKKAGVQIWRIEVKRSNFGTERKLVSEIVGSASLGVAQLAAMCFGARATPPAIHAIHTIT